MKKTEYIKLVGVFVMIFSIITVSIYRYTIEKNGQLVKHSKQYEGYKIRKNKSLFFDEGSLEYIEEIHGLINISDTANRMLMFEGKILETIKTVDGKEVYLLPFEQTDFIFEEQYGKIYIVILSIIQKNSKEINGYIDAEGYYIGADFSYICTQKLLLASNGRCNEESYYLD